MKEYNLDSMTYNIFADIMIEEERGKDLYAIKSKKEILENPGYRNEWETANRIMENCYA